MGTDVVKRSVVVWVEVWVVVVGRVGVVMVVVVTVIVVRGVVVLVGHPWFLCSQHHVRFVFDNPLSPLKWTFVQS